MNASDLPPKHTQAHQASPEEYPEIVKTLGRAFSDDPIVHWLIRPGADYQQRIDRLYWVLTVKFAHKNGEILCTDNHKGAALWYPPGKAHIPFIEQLKVLPDLINVAGLGRLPKRLSAMQQVQNQHPKEPHYYLQAIGVDPSYQGRGYSSALMNPILQRCDEQRLGAYLESSKEDNIPIYRRFGFEVTRQVNLSRHGPSVWLMWRDPR